MTSSDGTAPARSPGSSPGEAASEPATADNPATITALTDLLVKAVRALGAAGDADQASRIAAKAWWVLKDWPRQAERVNGTMHYLARLPQSPPAQPSHDPTRSLVKGIE